MIIIKIDLEQNKPFDMYFYISIFLCFCHFSSWGQQLKIFETPNYAWEKKAIKWIHEILTRRKFATTKNPWGKIWNHGYSPVPKNSPPPAYQFFDFLSPSRPPPPPLFLFGLLSPSPLINFPDYVLQIFQRSLKRIVLFAKL